MKAAVIAILFGFVLAQISALPTPEEGLNHLEKEHEGHDELERQKKSAYEPYAAPAPAKAPAPAYAAPAYAAPVYAAPAYGAPAPAKGHAHAAHGPVVYSYQVPAPTVPCAKNVLVGCAPALTPVPCAPAHAPAYAAPAY